MVLQRPQRQGVGLAFPQNLVVQPAALAVRRPLHWRQVQMAV